uniref:Odorant receptor n=1 Tax=Adelphocoris lineolatus TaxID=236346 RepID=A0A2I4PH38_ADELI|nr:olfactory receptor 38 [Adelphocoris lineolatus]
MSFLLRFIQNLAAEEDEEFLNLLRKDYWIFLHASMVLPTWKHPIVSFCLFFHHATCLFMHFVIFSYSMYLLLQEGNLEVFSLVLHYNVILSFAVFLVVYCNYMRKELVRLHKIFVTDIGIYRNGRIYSDKWCTDMYKIIQLEKYYFLMIPGLMAAMGGLVCVVPYVFKSLVGIEHPYSSTGLSMTLPVPAWYPFPTHEGIWHLVVMLGQFQACGLTAFLIVNCQYMLLNITSKLKYEIRVIGHSLDTLLTRSQTFHDRITSIHHGQHKPVTVAILQTVEHHGKKRDVLTSIDDEGFQRFIGEEFKDSISHHQTIAAFLSEFQSFGSVPLAAALLLGVVVIAMSLYNILMGMRVDDMGIIVTFSLVIITETLAMYVVTALGASLTDELELLRSTAYFMSWEELDKGNRKIFLNFFTVITEPFALKAAGITDLNMETFSSLLNSAYSFFNIMNSVD